MSELLVVPERMTCASIQNALFYEFDRGGAVICFNTTKVLAHEADVLIVRKSGVSIECEVKVSRSDFFADFRKVEKHQQLASGYRFGPQHFYYAAEPHVIPIERVPAYAGLLHVSRADPNNRGKLTQVVVAKEAPRLHRQPHEGIHERMCRSMMYKAYYNAD